MEQDLIARIEFPIPSEKAGGQFEVVPRCPHRDGNRSVAEANFQRLLHGQQILESGVGVAFDLLDGYREDGSVHTDLMVTRGNLEP